MTILLLANPRAGSQLASVYVTDYPKESTKLVIQPNGQMISCKLRIFNVHDKDDKKEYFSQLENLAPTGNLEFYLLMEYVVTPQT